MGIECYIKCLVQEIRVRKSQANAAPENEYVYVNFTKRKKRQLGNNSNILAFPSNL